MGDRAGPGRRGPRGYKDIYRALVGARGGAIAIGEIRGILAEIVKQELSGVQDSETLPRDVRIQFVVGAFLIMLKWWLEQRPRLTPSEVDAMFRRLVLDGIGPLGRATPRHG
jgi:hypothetical protein